MSTPTSPTEALKQAAVVIQKLKSRISVLEQQGTQHEPIAVVGIGCRYAGGVTNPDSFWALLREGRDGVIDANERWRELGIPPSVEAPRWAALLEQVDRFDPALFGISPREAAGMDPQQRLLLEVSWEALEEARIPPLSLQDSRTGVFIGASLIDYRDAIAQVDPAERDAYATTGTLLSIAAGRISYTLGLQGPCLVVDTACSSSLVSVHLACQSLRNKESDLALAGGVGLILSPESIEMMARTQALAPDGRCKTFDASANGYVRGEGCGILVLKRLSDAQRDGDRIWAIVRGSAINQDGKSTGLTAPNVLSQQRLLQDALKDAKLSPGEVGYVECHGTGTSLGDPIEIEALRTVYGAPRPDGARCVLGAAKTNLGHTECAAGVAGLIKAILVLHRAEIPRNLNFRTLNPRIRLDGTSLQLATEARAWPRGTKPHVAGVSSFGMSGTNAHILLEAAPLPTAQPEAPSEQAAQLLLLSGKSEAALRELGKKYAAHVAEHPEQGLGDVAYSAATTRSLLDVRAGVVLRDSTQAQEALLSLAENVTPAFAVKKAAAFLCSGQGSQRAGMGKELAERFPVFKKAVEECAAGLEGKLPRPLLSVMWAEEGSEDASLLDQTQYTQAALFTFEYALYQLWSSLGVEADYLLGHSIGEIVAACVAGVFSLPDALSLVAARGTLMQALPRGGAMLSLDTHEATVTPLLAGREQEVSLAALNGPAQTVIAGTEAAVSSLGEALAAQGVKGTRLTVSHAFHSPLMEPMLAPFRAVLETLSFSPPKKKLVSNLTGQLAGENVATPSYWVDHVRHAVRFTAGAQALVSAGVNTWIELGPKSTLLGLVSQLGTEETPNLLSSTKPKRHEAESFLASLGDWFSLGGDLDPKALFPLGGRKLSLPHYPFQRQRYWIEATSAPVQRRATPGEHPLLGRALVTESGEWIWETVLADDDHVWLRDHVIQGAVLYPGAAYVEMALAAGQAALRAAPRVEHVRFLQALSLPEDNELSLQLALRPDGPERYTFRITSKRASESTRTLHAEGQLTHGGVPPLVETPANVWQEREVNAFYDALRAAGLAYGPSFRGVAALSSGERVARANIRAPEGLALGAFRLHPALLDACFQATAAVGALDGDTWLPVGVASVEGFQRLPARFVCQVQQREASDAEHRLFDLYGLAEDGALLFVLRGFEAKRLASAAPARDRDWLLGIDWVESVAATPSQQGHWLLLGAGEPLRAAIEAQGGYATVLPAEATVSREVLSAWMKAHVAAAPRGVVVLAASGAPEEGAFASCDLALRALHAIQQQGWRDAPRLWLVTQGAASLASGAPLALAQAPLHGMGRVLEIEHPELRCTRVDLDPNAPSFAALAHTLAADEPERELAFRGEKRFVARLTRQQASTAQEQTRPARAPYRLEIDQVGQLGSLVLRERPLLPPGPGEVQVKVEAAGLNFLDVLLALGVMPNDTPGETSLRLGGEFAGQVVAVGEGVELRPSDAVFGIAQGSFASHLTTRATLVAKRPSGLGAEEAAALPIAYLTAWYALDRIARLQPGERVLIHAATGGVGLAAIQWAQHVGAEVYATAGSEEKRALLRSLGVKYVSDSRSRAFVDDIRGWTKGEGVDVVLNSLSGEFIELSLGLLRDYGRFLEIGKRDYYANHSLGLRPFLKNLSFSLVDLRGMSINRPQLVRQLLQEFSALYQAGVFRAPQYKAFPASRAEEMFREMSQAKHTGKLVLRFHEEAPLVRVPAEGGEIRGEGTYLLTGGLGGLGLSLAGWLVEQGARSLVLLGRHGASSPSQQAAVQALRDAGATVQVFRADAANRPQLEQVFWAIDQQLPPLRGVFHLAGFLDDGLLLQQSEERFRRVMEPKIGGAWNLHELTKERKLDQFVLYSSVASLLGSPGQGNYAAANAYLDALAHERRRMGLPALSLNWGPFSDVGMAAHAEAKGARVSGRGLDAIRPEDGNRVLGELLQTSAVQIGVAALQLRQWLQFYPSTASSPFWSVIAREQEGSPKPVGNRALLEQLRQQSEKERLQTLTEFVSAQVSQVFRLPASEIQAKTPFTSLGMDSLMSLELRNKLESSLSVSLSSAVFWTYSNIDAFVRYLVGEFFTAPGKEATAKEEVLVVPTLPDDLSALSESEKLGLLEDKLAHLEALLSDDD